jgi:hypothetical protein
MDMSIMANSSGELCIHVAVNESRNGRLLNTVYLWSTCALFRALRRVVSACACSVGPPMRLASKRVYSC